MVKKLMWIYKLVKILHFFSLKPVFFKGFIIFRFELCSMVASKKNLLLEKMGYFNSDNSFSFLSLNTLSFGFWLNSGSFFKNSLQFIKYLMNFLIKF